MFCYYWPPLTEIMQCTYIYCYPLHPFLHKIVCLYERLWIFFSLPFPVFTYLERKIICFWPWVSQPPPFSQSNGCCLVLIIWIQGGDIVICLKDLKYCNSKSLKKCSDIAHRYDPECRWAFQRLNVAEWIAGQNVKLCLSIYSSVHLL